MNFGWKKVYALFGVPKPQVEPQTEITPSTW